MRILPVFFIIVFQLWCSDCFGIFSGINVQWLRPNLLSEELDLQFYAAAVGDKLFAKASLLNGKIIIYDYIGIKQPSQTHELNYDNLKQSSMNRIIDLIEKINENPVGK